VENPIECGDFRKLEGGGEKLSCQSQPQEVEWGMPASAHRLSARLMREAPVVDF